MRDSFYRAFEDRFRGSRELIKSRLRVYLPFVRLIKDHFPNARALDLGCGRGEWLELLKETEIIAEGVDINEDMLTACHQRGLDVRVDDAFSALSEYPANTFAIVSGFHIIEHLQFEDLQRFVKDSLRVIKPGGLLILETPNPENLVVATSRFYLDPTHRRPIPAELLSFLAEHYGFSRTQVMRLSGLPDTPSKRTTSLLDVIQNLSPDYALLAQKVGDEIVMRSFNSAFDLAGGSSLTDLALRFEERLVRLEERLVRAERAQETLEMLRRTRSWRLLSWVNKRLIQL